MVNLNVLSDKPRIDHKPTRRSRLARMVVHSLRVAVFVAILVMIRLGSEPSRTRDNQLSRNPAALEFINEAFSNRGLETQEDSKLTIGPFDLDLGMNIVFDDRGDSVGAVLQTSPQCDHLIGYSGPTNCLIAIDQDRKIRSIKILDSDDTAEHVDIVKRDEAFFDAFRGMAIGDSESDPSRWQNLDAVSGATLTSYAIIASIAHRTHRSVPNLKFRAEPDLDNVKAMFSNAARIEPESHQLIWSVLDENQEKLGSVLTTTPVGDHLSGYQGPTATLAGFDIDGKCVGLVVDQTYDNEPYATYLNDDYSFLDFYLGKTLEEIAKLNPSEYGIDGVSGATMTSQAVAEALPIAAADAIAKPNRDGGESRTSRSSEAWQSSTRSLWSYGADVVTIFLVTIGVSLSFTKLRQAKAFRTCFQVGSILILGFYSGHMLSMASMAGWSAHAIPWRVAPGLVFLAVAALIVPIFSKHQPYCQHICPFGAIQQMTRNRVGWKVRISKPIRRVLELIPFVLLMLVVVVAMTNIPFNLASIEPFNGFGVRVAGWATIAIFVFGILFSAVSPMAYCRYGCPTGAMINFVKYQSTSDRLGLRDVAALFLTLIALGLLYT